MLFKIAWRNIWRNRSRSLVVMGSLVLGLWAGMFMMAYAIGMYNQRLSSAVESEVSHIQIHEADYLTDKNIKLTIPEGDKVLAGLLASGDVKTAAGRQLAYGMLSTTSGASGVKIIGIDTALENRLTQLSDKIVEGEFLSGIRGQSVLVGEKLLKKYKLKLKSKLVLSFQDSEGNIVSGSFRVAGVFKTSNSQYDGGTVFVHGEDLGALAGTQNSFNEIAILLNSFEQVDTVAAGLKASYPNLQTDTWKTLAPELELMIESMDQYLWIFIGIILLALAFGIINTMLMAVLERVREIGMLMAVGMNKARLFFMIVLETLFLVAAATPIGLLASYLSINYFNQHGIDLSIVSEGLSNLGFENIVYPVIYREHFIQVVIMVFITAILSSLYPAFTALRLNPVNAIRKI